MYKLFLKKGTCSTDSAKDEKKTIQRLGTSVLIKKKLHLPVRTCRGFEPGNVYKSTPPQY